MDVIFYNSEISYEETLEIEKSLKQNYPLYDWEVKNQVYMNSHNPHTKPYLSSADALTKFPETCTAIGLRLDSNNQLELLAPFGIKDLVSLTIKPTPFFMEDTDRMTIYQQRVENKQWLKK